jgi:uncharacterized protein (DUF885 family)
MTPDEIHQLGLNEVAVECENGKSQKKQWVKGLYWDF